MTDGAPPRDPPLLLAHRGARAHAPENTLEAFHLAVRLGATAVESDVWVTADGVAVLDHDGVVGFRRRRVAALTRAELPEHVPSLAELLAELPPQVEVCLDVKDPAALEATVGAARDAGAEQRLWLCHDDLELLATWRPRTTARLVDSTRLRRMKEGPERRAARLRDLGVDAVNLHWSDWTAGHVALFHRFERFVLGWDAQHVRQIAAVLRMGVDGVFGDHVDRLIEGAQQAGRAG